MKSTTFQFDTALQFVADGQEERPDEIMTMIHQFADPATTRDDFAIVELTAISDRPVLYGGSRIIIPAEWMNQYHDRFIGLPLMRDHGNKTSEKIGRLFQASVVEEDGVTSIKASAFISKQFNQDDVDRIRQGIDREVSIGFNFSSAEEVDLNGVPHLRIQPTGDRLDGPTEVSIVGRQASKDAQITSIAAAAQDRDVELTDIPQLLWLSESDRECLLYGRQQKERLIQDVVSYERQLGLISDVSNTTSYVKLSPINLQDRRDSLLSLLKKREKETTQCSIDCEALLSEATEGWTDPASVADIIAGIKGRK